MSLGGGAVGGEFVLSALPLAAAAAGGVGGWAIAGGALLAAAAAGGAGGGGGAANDTTAPGAAKVALPEAANGVNATEAADGTPVVVTLPTDAIAGDTVTTVVTKPDGTKLTLTHVLTAADVAAKTLTQLVPASELKDANGQYMDGTWTLTTTVTDAAKNVSTPVESQFVLDTTAPSNQTGHLVHDDANDTGVDKTDSITSQDKPYIEGMAEKGATVTVVVNGKSYTTTASTTDGSYKVQVTDTLSNGQYTPKITVTDGAGNSSTVDGTPFTVDKDKDQNYLGGIPSNDLNTGGSTTVVITAASDDTGTSATDFITSDRSVVISGTVAQFDATGGDAGDWVHVQVFNAQGVRVAHEYVKPNGNAWTMTKPTADLPDGDYTVKADIVDAADNVVKSAPVQPLKISAVYLQAVADTGSATEAGGLNNATVGASAVGNVLTNDRSVFSLSQLSVKPGTLSGTYGTLVLAADGSYTYTLNDAAANVESLNGGDIAHDTFIYTTKNTTSGLTVTSDASLTIEIKGANDNATIDPKSINTGSLSIHAANVISGQIFVNDIDDGEARFIAPSATALKGTYGDFKFNEATGEWQYTANNTTTLQHGAIAHDLLVVQSWDKTATETISVTVIGENAAPVIDGTVRAVDSVDGNSNSPVNGIMPVGATLVKTALLSGVTDGNNDALGIAITSIDTQHGHLFYTIDNGLHWNEVVNVSLTNALLLSVDDSTRIYYQQTISGVDGAFTYVAWDHTAPQSGSTADVTARGGSTAFSETNQKVLVNDVFNLTSISATPVVTGGTGFDTLVINPNEFNWTLDLSTATNSYPLSGIEKIDITGSGNNTVTLNLASITQADAVNSVHKLYITGDAGDAVSLTDGPANWKTPNPTTETVGTVSYNVYHIDSTHDLLINQAITNIT